MRPGRDGLGLLLGLVGVTIFGGTVPATRIAVAGLDPFFITAGRAAVAGLMAATILLALRRARPSARQFRLMVLAGLLMVLGFPSLMALGLQTVPAAHAGVVLGIMPLTTAAAASLILGERPSLRFWFFAVLGTVVVVAFALRDGGGRFDIGDLYLLAAGILSSTGYVYSGALSREMPGWEVICWILVIALPFSLPVALWLAPGAPGKLAKADPPAIRDKRHVARPFSRNRSEDLGRHTSRIFACRRIPAEHRPLPFVLVEQPHAADRSLGLGHDRFQNMPEIVGRSRHHRLVEQLAVIFKGAGEFVVFHDLDPVSKTLRDYVSADTSRVLIDDAEAFGEAQRYARRAMPELLDREEHGHLWHLRQEI